MQSVSKLLRTSRAVRFQSTYTKPRTGVNPAYDEALKRLRQKELKDAQAKSASSAEVSALKKKYFDLAVEAEINDSEVLWNARHGNYDLSKPVYAHLKEQAWRARPLEILMQRLLQMYVLPDLLDPREVGIPPAQLNVALAETLLEPGSVIEPSEARKQPEIELTTFHEDTRLHTLVMVDLDEPHVEQQTFREQFHWVVANLPFSMSQTKTQISEGSELLAYIPPHPARGSPTHRYAFVAFEQPDGGKQRIENIEVSRDLVLREFAKQHHLRPVGLSFFRANWNESVDEVYRDVLKLAPPSYGQMPALRTNYFPSDDEYVSESALKNLRNYQYRAWAVTLFPRWMAAAQGTDMSANKYEFAAPNLITLTGLSFEIFDVFLLLLLMPDLAGPGPWWLYFAFGIGMWLYSTFDNVDGKQARRTGTSSPLGELFDHGCDALELHDCGDLTIIFLTTSTFFLSTWEEYHTGVLYLGYINGPTEVLTFAVFACFASGIWGPWDLAFMDAALFVTVLAAVFGHYGVCCWNVYKACKEQNRSFAATLPQLLQYVAYATSCYVWLTTSVSIFHNNHLVLFLVTSGIVFGRIVSKIILAHLTEMPFPSYTVQMVPLVVGAALSFFGLFSARTELLFLVISFLFVTVAYFHWALVVIERFCEFLGINCLTIAPRKNRKKAE
ncbi:hypothetical protein DL89DRAFT_295598 [Linderina pennispora]|uniref:PEBP-like protein n=1 Tax=Linderina pennispora TaxID=61395 RepID=A0A1Y1VZA8_9FUNG|nr:uncharacterized protein DL89DRAFT_295598 [Linderina pennispora]ORX66355.1 hypothetical protein DL89DRAFT_295598 [Linderina pennispora]